MTSSRRKSPPPRNLEERNCDALNCRKRTDLRRVKSFIPGVLVHLWLCEEHTDMTEAAIHEKFREEFGLDFVDPARN